MKHNSQDS